MTKAAASTMTWLSANQIHDATAKPNGLRKAIASPVNGR